MAPTPPIASRIREREAQNNVNFYKRSPDGTMRIVAPNESLWSK
jgi:hypothetical protein